MCRPPLTPQVDASRRSKPPPRRPAPASVAVTDCGAGRKRYIFHVVTTHRPAPPPPPPPTRPRRRPPRHHRYSPPLHPPPPMPSGPAVRGAPALGPPADAQGGAGLDSRRRRGADFGAGRKRAEPPAPGPPPLGSGAEPRRKCRARAVRVDRFVGWDTVAAATAAAAFVAAAAAACFHPATVDAITPPPSPSPPPLPATVRLQAPAPQPSGAGPPLLPQTRVLPRAGPATGASPAKARWGKGARARGCMSEGAREVGRRSGGPPGPEPTTCIYNHDI